MRGILRTGLRCNMRSRVTRDVGFHAAKNTTGCPSASCAIDCRLHQGYTAGGFLELTSSQLRPLAAMPKVRATAMRQALP